MKSGTRFNQGEVVLVPFPFSNLSGVKKRPVLILSKTKNNEVFEDVIVCGITANLKKSPYSVLIDNHDLEKGGIPVKSRIKIDKLFTIEKNLIVKKLGILNKKSFSKVKKEFCRLV